MTENVKNAAPKILEIIKASNNILLHCHPSPDPDSVGSALAMKFALEQLGKKATVIAGDSAIPEAFMHFPGATEILPKNFFEIDLAQFDLFIVQDSGSLGMISRKGPVVFPESLKTVVIDHHASNEKFAKDFNIVDISYPAVAAMLFDFFKEWKINITPEIAANLFIGSYTDTGGFKFASTTPETYAMAAELTKIYPKFSDLIFKMDNCLRPEALIFQGLALSSIDTLFDGHIAVSSVSYDDIQKKKITADDMSSGWVANLLKSVVGWDVGISLVEEIPNEIHVSFRTRNPEKYDLSKIASSLGGGGHKAAAGATIMGTLAEAKAKIIAAIEEYVKMGGQK